jgi:hypothetical protein
MSRIESSEREDFDDGKAGVSFAFDAERPFTTEARRHRENHQNCFWAFSSPRLSVFVVIVGLTVCGMPVK